MRHLLDAHSLIWALDDPSKLGRSAHASLEDSANDLAISVGTIWELSIKAGGNSHFPCRIEGGSSGPSPILA